MTAVPRDPDFWRRFSVAIHQSESTTDLPSQQEQHSHLLTPPQMPAVKSSAASSTSSFSDLEKQSQHPSASASTTTLSRPNHARGSSWLEHERSKQRKGKWMMPLFVFAVVGLIVLIILVLIWLSSHGWFAHGEKFSVP